MEERIAAQKFLADFHSFCRARAIFVCVRRAVLFSVSAGDVVAVVRLWGSDAGRGCAGSVGGLYMAVVFAGL